MRAALVTVFLLAIAAPAAARPLDPDRGFARDGVFRMDEPSASASVIALRDGGTLHATDLGLMRLSARGRLRGFTPRGALELAPGLALGGSYESGKKARLEAWPLDAAGRPGETRVIELPRSAMPVRVVRRPGGYAALVWLAGRGGMQLVALTRRGALDTRWGNGGTRRVAGDFEDLALAASRDGSLTVTRTPSLRCFGKRQIRARLHVRRFGPTGAPGLTRRLAIGARSDCPLASTGEALVDGRGRIVIAGYFGASVALVRLTPDLRRDRTFTAGVRASEGWQLPARLERLRGGGYALGFTGGGDGPRATVALFDRRGRRRGLRRLKVSKRFPTSALTDLAVDRRGGIVAAGSLHDTNVFIREDYGVPHVAVWRVRRR